MKNEDRLEQIIHQLVHSKSEADTRAAYQAWAESYDGDLDSFGYVAPQIGVSLFHQALGRPQGPVFDAGCGTGQVGKLLAGQGYSQLHGADFSPEMLAKAADLSVYRSLTQMNFRKSLPIANHFYDGVICIGVYSSFFGTLFLQELIRIVKPGGIITMSARPVHYDDDLRLQIDRHLQTNLIELIDHQLRPYMTGQGAEANYVVLKKR